MGYKSKNLISSLLGYKGNRGFQDFEHWQAMSEIAHYLFVGHSYGDTELLSFLTDGNEKVGKYKWDITRK